MKPYPIFLPVVLAVCIGLVAACKRPEGTETKPADKSQSVSSSQEAMPLSREQLAEKKLAVYANIHNALLHEEDGLPRAYQTLEKTVLKAKAPDKIDFPVMDSLEETLQSLRENRAAAGKDESETDKAADALIAAGDKLLEHEKELAPYFRDRVYKTDRMEKAKAAFPALKKDFELALAALSDFGTEILKEKRAATEKRMEVFKASGDMVRYHTEEILMLSEELLALFDDPGVQFNRNEAFSKGNSITVKLNNAIQAQRQAADDARSRADHVSPYYDAIRNHAAGIISDYREVRDKRSKTAFASMLKRYDRAAQDYNSAQMKAQPGGT